MTAKEKFKALMAEFQVPLVVEDNSLIIERSTPEVPTIGGYSGFSAQFTFTPEGAFTNVSIWE